MNIQKLLLFYYWFILLCLGIALEYNFKDYLYNIGLDIIKKSQYFLIKQKEYLKYSRAQKPTRREGVTSPYGVNLSSRKVCVSEIQQGHRYGVHQTVQ